MQAICCHSEVESPVWNSMQSVVEVVVYVGYTPLLITLYWQVVHEGSVVGMKTGKDDVTEARKETECGIAFTTDPGFREGDRVQCLTRRKVPQTLNWDLQF